MSQPRMNIYGFPHKGIRIALSELSKLSGKIDYSNESSLNELKSITNEITMLLDLHLHSEEGVVLRALESKVPGSIHENVEEHEKLEQEVADFKAKLNEITVKSSPDLGANFYSSFSNFHSNYLAHMAMEEGEMNPIIWDNFSDQEILGWQGAIMASLTPDQTMKWFKYIVPALSPIERSMIMGGFKQNAPSEFFDATLEMLKSYMEESELLQLKAMLS